jgi:PAS domain S-box-containing protein
VINEPVKSNQGSVTGWSRNVILVMGVLPALMVAVNVFGYATHNFPLASLGLPLAVKFNSLLAMGFCSASLLLLLARKTWLVHWLAAAPVIIGAVTLAEYLFDWNAGIDQFFFKDLTPVDSAYAGRMTPLTAACYIFLGAGLIIGETVRSRRFQMTGTATLTMVVMMISCVAVLGYFFGIEVASGWQSATHMTVQTGGAFFCLGCGLLIWVHQTAEVKQYDFVQWIPITGAVTLMTMIASLSMVTVTDLKKSREGRKQTGEVIAAAAGLEDRFLDVQRATRAYVTLGMSQALEAYQQATNELPRHFLPLINLTSGDASKSARVKELGEAITEALEYDALVIKIYRQKGAGGVLKYEETGKARNISGQSLDEFKEFNDNEQKLLEARDEAEQSNFNNVGRLLTFGSVLAALLLLLAHSMTSREVWRRRALEKVLRESEERFRGSFDNAPIGMALVSLQGRWLKVNRALCEMLGYGEEELLKLTFQRITHPEDLNTDLGNVQQVLSGRLSSYQMEKRYFHKRGQVVFVTLSVSLVRNRKGEPLYFISQVENITERKRVEQQIAASLNEKDALLREIHHRVKNNLQVISSILKLQANYIHDPDALEVFNDCQDRIRTMALIHEKLYRTEGLARINFKDYLESLTGLLLRSQAGKGTEVRHEVQLESVEVDIDTAIPLGLIANELISNCLKHAFIGRPKALVVIKLQRSSAGECRLAVKDDGNGLSNDFSLEQTKSLGMRLVKILAEQIRGRVKYETGQGTEFVITFANRAK